jgi:hypothetical protein
MAIMLMHHEMQGSLDFSAGFSVGSDIASISAGLTLHAKAGYSVLFAGGFFSGQVGLAFYGEARAYLAVELSVRLAIEFHIHIDLLFGSADLSWSIHFSATILLGFDAQVEMLVGTGAQAIRGHGIIYFGMCGFSFSPSVAFSGGNLSAMEEVRERLRLLIPAGLALSPA